jgi:hypothetical protein
MVKKTENCSSILVCHFTENRSMKLFLNEYRIEKKNRFWPNPKFVTYLTHGTPLKIRHFKNDLKNHHRSHRFYS